MVPRLLSEFLVSVAFCFLSRYSHTGSREQGELLIGTFFLGTVKKKKSINDDMHANTMRVCSPFPSFISLRYD